MTGRHAIGLLLPLAVGCARSAPDTSVAPPSLVGTRWEFTRSPTSDHASLGFASDTLTDTLIIKWQCPSAFCAGNVSGELLSPFPGGVDTVIVDALREVLLFRFAAGEGSVDGFLAPRISHPRAELRGEWRDGEVFGTYVTSSTRGPLYGQFTLRPLRR